MADEFEWFLGIDWGSEVHALCLLDATGRIRGTRTVAHTRSPFTTAVHWVREQTGTPPAAIAVGIETPRGALVDTVIEHGFPVFAVNPKQLDRFRDRFTAAGAKDDDRDAQVLADALRTDRRAFRRVRSDDPLIIQLREATRLREDLLEDEQRLANRLREQLYRVDAAWLTLSPAADEPWLWAILADAPDPATWPQLVAAPPGRRAARPSHSPRDARRGARGDPTAAPDRGAGGDRGGRHAHRARSCRSCRWSPSSASWPNGGSIACWNSSRPSRPSTASRVSIVTSRFSSPCPESEEW